MADQVHHHHLPEEQEDDQEEQEQEPPLHRHDKNKRKKKHKIMTKDKNIPPPPPSPPPPSRPYSVSSPYRTFCTIITILLLLLGATVLILWLIYRPQKPEFSVAAAAIYNLNATGPPFITTSMQFTLVARNPNKRVSITYDRLTAYVSYRDQVITPPVSLPPFYQERRSTVAMSPVMGGGEGVPVPASVDVVNGLVVDEAYGVVALRVVVLGRLRWKAGAIRTGRYGLYVKCDVWVGYKKGFVGQVPLLGGPSTSQCKVEV